MTLNGFCNLFAIINRILVFVHQGLGKEQLIHSEPLTSAQVFAVLPSATEGPVPSRRSTVTQWWKSEHPMAR